MDIYFMCEQHNGGFTVFTMFPESFFEFIPVFQEKICHNRGFH